MSFILKYKSIDEKRDLPDEDYTIKDLFLQQTMLYCPSSVDLTVAAVCPKASDEESPGLIGQGAG